MDRVVMIFFSKSATIMMPLRMSEILDLMQYGTVSMEIGVEGDRDRR